MQNCLTLESSGAAIAEGSASPWGVLTQITPISSTSSSINGFFLKYIWIHILLKRFFNLSRKSRNVKLPHPERQWRCNRRRQRHSMRWRRIALHWGRARGRRPREAARAHGASAVVPPPASRQPLLHAPSLETASGPASRMKNLINVLSKKGSWIKRAVDCSVKRKLEL